MQLDREYRGSGVFEDLEGKIRLPRLFQLPELAISPIEIKIGNFSIAEYVVKAHDD